MYPTNNSNLIPNLTPPPQNSMQYNHDRSCKKTPLILHNGKNIRKKHIKGNLKRINLSLNAWNENENKKKEKTPEVLHIVPTPQRNKFQKLIEIIGYKMSQIKLSEFFDSNCRQSVICWKCCIDETSDSVIKIHKFNRQVQAYKCTHTCIDKKRYSWRKEMTANDGLYYEHNKTFKENMARIQQIYKSSTKPVMDATDTRKRKFAPPVMDKNKFVREPEKKKVKCNIDIHMEKLELENIIKVQHMEKAKFNNICCMNEWYDSMVVLEVNYNNLTRMYRRIEKEIKNSELLSVIMQVMKRYTDSINELKLKMNLFENGWNGWNKQQIVYWIKNIEGGMFSSERYKKFFNEIENCVLINNGSDMLKFNDLALLLLGLKSGNDRDIIRLNVNRLVKVCDESKLESKSIGVKSEE